MPFGSIASNRRLGIANIPEPNASVFSVAVLNLPGASPVYQQQVVHNTLATSGPPPEAAWCGSVDSDYNRLSIIREVSPSDTVFGRRNIRVPSSWDLEHHWAYGGQTYYIVNEPEFANKRELPNGPCSPCWAPRDLSIDPYFGSGACNPFPSADGDYWEVNQGVDFYVPCSIVPDPRRRIKPEALAYAFLKLWRATPPSSALLPPAFAGATLGYNSTNDLYWRFFDRIHNGVTSGSCYESGITPAQLKALHIHHYENSIVYYPYAPLEGVAQGATRIRRGADWYKQRYLGGGALPADVLVSETGPDWRIKYVRGPGSDVYEVSFRPFYPKAWAGGYNNFRDGLAWWNSYLCWLTRRAPFECNVTGWDTGAHTVHACIHEPSQVPFVSEATTDRPPDGTDLSGYYPECVETWRLRTDVRFQSYLDVVAWYPYTHYGPGVINVPALSTVGRYERSFTAFTTLNWQNKVWRRGPLGACYAVWATVGADAITYNLNTGWTYIGQTGSAGTATVNLPTGWSTVYFPMIKADVGGFSADTRISAKWMRDGLIRWHGYLDMNEFPDTATFYNNPNDWLVGYPSQTIYSAMVFPVVVNSNVDRSVTVELWRSGTSGPGVWLGRPVVLPGACSWFGNQ